MKTMKWKFLNSTTIKLLAAAFMFLDHIHQMFASAGAPVWLTMAGRPVFPLFLFAAAESFHFTRSKKNYLKRLLFASWGMTLYTFLLQRAVPNENVVLMNNAFSTFFVAGLYMLFWDWFTEGIAGRDFRKTVIAVLCCLIPVLCALPVFFCNTCGKRQYSLFRNTAAYRFITVYPKYLDSGGRLCFCLAGRTILYFQKKQNPADCGFADFIGSDLCNRRRFPVPDVPGRRSHGSV